MSNTGISKSFWAMFKETSLTFSFGLGVGGAAGLLSGLGSPALFFSFLTAAGDGKPISPHICSNESSRLSLLLLLDLYCTSYWLFIFSACSRYRRATRRPTPVSPAPALLAVLVVRTDRAASAAGPAENVGRQRNTGPKRPGAMLGLRGRRAAPGSRRRDGPLQHGFDGHLAAARQR